ncbi:UDP-2,4-diacetamido-2,4,6-trideoxy-beta-L-altropyranose hydrolase [Pseudoalteromonas atlantica]|uniref:UDP-2,4-diacetamido-2,4, 6-trideoxy-beta-L-altropyranose hydrolase n=1 Tax=Pseudoalteromonas atlantica TaxID=288 RepID=UPI003735B0CE
MNIVARVSTCLGIGHLMRIKWLLLELQSSAQSNITLVLDTQKADITPFIQELVCVDIHFVETGSKQDLATLLCAIKTSNADLVIIDHYDLNIEYEKQISDAGTKLAVFDDLGREHDCDFLFDAKWEGELTQKRYDGKLPAKTQRFLGPDFSLLAPPFSQALHARLLRSKTKANVLCSLGGGGDLSVFASLVNSVPHKLHSQIQFTVVVGPKAENKQVITRLGEKFKNITTLCSPLSIANEYRNTDLFIGALGTSLYELAALKVPAITFSIAANQENDITHLQQLGHFLHLDELSDSQACLLGSQLGNFICCLPRIKKLRNNTSVTVDGLGVKRVAAILQAQQYHVSDKNNHVKDGNYITQLTGEFSVREVQDSDINNYLAARNLSSNSQRMTINAEIPRLKHYLWWFRSERQSYVVEQAGVPSLYIWHQHVSINTNDYLYGGWFTACNDVPFNLAMLTLQWQLDFCRASHPEAIWLAVIHKDNKFVNLLNKYMGFVATPTDSIEYKTTQKLFPLADEQFNFVMWDPNAQ